MSLPGVAGRLPRAFAQGRGVRALGAFLLLACVAAPLRAQDYRLRLDGRFQAVGYRGLQLDSISVADTVAGATAGPTTPGGFAVRCPAGALLRGTAHD